VSCSDEQAGSVIEVQIGNQRLEGRVPAVSLEPGKWMPYPLGEVDLKAGKTVLSIRALDIVRESVMDLGHVLLQRIQ